MGICSLNTANYASSGSWNRPGFSAECLVTTVGTNGNDSYFGTKDQDGLVFEIIENGAAVGGSYASSLSGLGKTAVHSQNINKRFFTESTTTNNIATAFSDTGFRVVKLINNTSYAESISFIDVGFVDNIADSNGLGNVDYDYKISELPVTNNQYVEFLNTIDPDASTGNRYYPISTQNVNRGIKLDIDRSRGQKYYSDTSMGDKPVVSVSMLNAIRYINWLHNRTSNLLRAIAGTTPTPTRTSTPTATYTPSITNTNTNTPTNTPTKKGPNYSPTPTKTSSPTPTITKTATPTKTPTKTPTPTLTPSKTPSLSSLTETGVYNLQYDIARQVYVCSMVRSFDAIYALPSINEWYKSAYSDPTVSSSKYWNYATRCDDPPQPFVVSGANISSGNGPVTYMSPTPTATRTPTPTPTQTPTNTPTTTTTQTPTNTPSITPTNTITPTVSPTNTVTPTITNTNTTTPTPTITNTPTNTSTPTNTQTRTPTRTTTPTTTPTRTPTSTRTPTPTITPTVSLSASPLPPYRNMVLTEDYSIKQYLGTGVMSLVERPSGRFTGDTLPETWDTFISSIGAIYGTQMGAVFPSYWVAENYAKESIKNTGLYELIPNQSYYFILKNNLSYDEIKIPDDRVNNTSTPDTPTIISCIDPQKSAGCPSIIINQTGVSDNTIKTSQTTLPIQIDVDLLGYNPNNSIFDYAYNFRSISANYPFRISPPSGKLTQSSRVIGIFEFCTNDDCLKASFDHDKDMIKVTDDINALVEFSVVPVFKIDANNSANFNKSTIWNNTTGNLTDVGTNGGPSFYNTYDMAGQLYEWTDTTLVANDKLSYTKKILRGGCYIDTNRFSLSKLSYKSHYLTQCFDYGGFGFRVAYSGSSTPVYPNFVPVSDTGNPPDTYSGKSHGSVSYNYYINKYMVTNNDYVEFLNSVDPSGLNSSALYNSAMATSVFGGIEFKSFNNSGNKYTCKSNMEKKPVNFITWINAAKMCNWMNNNKSPDTDLNSGSYNLLTGSIRSSSGNYFIPSSDEWYKAAYYNPNATVDLNRYTLYPTKSNQPILPVLSDSFGVGTTASGTCLNVEKYNFNVYGQNLFPPKPCPSIKMTDHKYFEKSDLIVTAAQTSDIVLTLNNLESGTLYGYEIQPVLSNWPSNISKQYDIIQNTGTDTTKRVNLKFSFCDLEFINEQDKFGYHRSFDIIPATNCSECNIPFTLDPTGLVNITNYKDKYVNTILKTSLFKLKNYKNINLTIPNNGSWIDTGIDLTNDSLFYSNASGTINYDSCANCKTDPNGILITDNCRISSSLPLSSLIAKIGYYDEPFLLGRNFTAYKSTFKTGRLYVAINNTCYTSSDYYNLSIDLAERFDSCKEVEDSISISCNRCLRLPRRSYAIPKFLTPLDNKEIIVTDNGCLQYIPLIIEVRGAAPKERYKYYFESSDDNLEFYPKGGTAHFAQGNGKITSLALFKNSIGLGIAKIILTRESNNTVSTDTITIKCSNSKVCEEDNG